MPIIRDPNPDGGFYVLRSSIREDSRLTWAARGLLVYLLGKPDHWSVSVHAIINETAASPKQSGRDAVRGLIAELVNAGYMTRDTKRTDDGSFEGITYRVRERPESPSPETEKPAPANPPLVNTDLSASTERRDSSSLRSEPANLFDTPKPSSQQTAQPPTPPPDPRPAPDDAMAEFWRLAADLEGRGIKRSICGAIAKLNPDPQVLVRTLKLAAQSHTPARYLGKVKANLEADRRAAGPPAPEADDREPRTPPRWVQEERDTYGAKVKWLGPGRWRDEIGTVRDDAGEVVQG